MRFGNAAWGFRETPLDEQLKITSDMGLELLELGIANAPNDLPEDSDGSQLDEVKALYKKYGVELLCAATGNDFTNGDDSDIKKIEHVIDMCQKLGVKYLRIFAGFSPVSEVVGQRWDNMISCLNRVYAYAKEKNVIPVVETHGGVNAFDDGVEHFMSTSAEPQALLKMISEVPDIQINYDPANLYAAGIGHPEDVYEKIKDKVCYAHLKDFTAQKSGHLLPSACGESDMDWSAILCAMKDFNGPALFEYENTCDVADGCRRSLEYIQSKLSALQGKTCVYKII